METPLEIEVKYLITTDSESIRNRIIANGASSSGCFYEYNIRYEDTNGSLKEKQQLLRLRKDNKASLTFKSKTESDDIRYKILKELEVEVSCFDTMKSILSALGFKEAQIYEKNRETFTIGKTTICLDEMPFARFIEIEGLPEDIDLISDMLGFSVNQKITANYLEIFSFIRTEEKLGFNDITFDNFRNIKKDYSSLICNFQIGAIS